VIKSGLYGNEQIIVSGLQRVRPGDEVKPTLVPMTKSENLETLQAMQQKVDEHRQVMLAKTNQAVTSYSKPHALVGGQ